MKTPVEPVVALLYLDLLKKVLTRTDFNGYQIPFVLGWKRWIYRPLRNALNSRNLQLVRKVTPAEREAGMGWPTDAETMVGLARLEHLQHCVKHIIQQDVPGDLIETGVWRGGASIFMKAALEAYGDAGRTVWLADSFQGLPKPDHNRGSLKGDSLWRYDELAVSRAAVQENFERYRLMDERVRFLEGWFADTLPDAPMDKLALIRLDGDMYDSTMVALESLYPKLSPGGFVVVDDYGAFAECAQAVEDFRRSQDITDPIETIDWTGAYWRRSG